MKALLLVALLLPLPCRAVDTDKVAHFGASYVGTALLYGLVKQMSLRGCRAQHPLPERCFVSAESRVLMGLTAAALVFVGGFIKEQYDPAVDRGDVLANGVGAAAATFSIVAFEF